ncbi:hypothetical protein E0Z10_g3 [Xylaria hypoxylon]|uniref:Uncharacterized protein n=1 Tax=Xylaria hypoxylon TaxID=37992 RepID=A0A4Z0YW66_9PEZI|nr:hypothetical protein E0Z10_g3 [Xylaria hypoxylon]
MASKVDTHPNFNIQQLLASVDAYNVDMNHFAALDFTTGQLDYTEDGDVDGIQTSQRPTRKIIGTSGLASCSGVVVLTQTRAVVAHYSCQPFIEDDFIKYLADHRAQLQNSKAWIMHRLSSDLDGPVDAKENDTFSQRLEDILKKDLGIDKKNITVLKYNQARDDQVEDEKGQGIIVVDGRNSPATVYARGF